jgi:hypothetical protein
MSKINNTHTHTRARLYIYIYILNEVVHKYVFVTTKKGKLNFALEQETKSRAGVSCSSTLSLTSALDGGGYSYPSGRAV